MGEVYLARHQRLSSRQYAIKLLKAGLVDEQSLARFEAEIDALDKLQHPNIVNAIDAGNWQGVSYLAMEYVDGIDLQSIDEECFPMSVANAAELIRQAATGLQHAHKLGLIHRDIKPSNLILNRSGVVKVLDLGLSRMKDRLQGELTLDSQVLGTPDYMAPEQWESTSGVDGRADIYSLGCTLYFLLSGVAPFGDEEHKPLTRKLQAHLSESPPDLASLRNDKVSREIQEILDRALAKRPMDRFQEPSELAEALEPFCSECDFTGILNKVPKRDFVVGESTKGHATATVDTDRVRETKPYSQPPMRDKPASFGWPLLLGTCGLVVVVATALLIWRPWSADGRAEGSGTKEQVSGADSNNADSNTSDSDQDASTVDRDVAITNAKSQALNQLKIQYVTRDHRNLGVTDPGQEFSIVGQVGRDVFAVRYGELLKISVHLEQPSYCYLFAMNPTDDNKYRIQRCFPNAGEVEPSSVEQFDYPARNTSYFGLTDGIGQIVFVLVTSNDPLSSFDEWQMNVEDVLAEWTVTDRAGAWAYANGELVALIPEQVEPLKFRGDVVEVGPRLFESVSRSLDEGDVSITAIAFPVDRPR